MSLIASIVLDLIDLITSHLDEFTGVGFAGLQWGDWLAGALTLLIASYTARRQAGWLWAFVFAWEASGFAPASSIPGVGLIISEFFNWFPIASLLHFFVDKTNPALKARKRLEQDIGAASHAKMNVDETRKSYDRVNKLIADSAPAIALPIARKAARTLEQRLRREIARIASSIEKEMGQVERYLPDASPELAESGAQIIADAKGALTKARAQLSKKDHLGAMETVTSGEAALLAAAQQYYAALEADVGREAA